MEEAWELAAVSGKFKDFEESTQKANQRFTSAAIISIVVSYFNLDEDPKLVAFAFKKVDECKVEYGLFGIALFLGLNYFLRVWDERNILSQINQDVSRYKHQINESWKNVVCELKRVHDENEDISKLVSEIEDENKNIGDHISSIRNLKRTLSENPKVMKQIDPGIASSVEKISDSLTEYETNLKMRGGSFSNSQSVTEKLQGAFSKLDIALSNGEQLQVVLENKKIFKGAVKFRIIVFNFFGPVFLMILMIFSLMFGQK